jgi:hypothetical protein
MIKQNETTPSCPQINFLLRLITITTIHTDWHNNVILHKTIISKRYRRKLLKQNRKGSDDGV